MLPATTERVPENTATSLKRRLRRETEERVAHYIEHPEDIAGRLDELDREWDVERTLEANAAALAFTGVALAASSDRRWLALPAVVTAFLFQHAIQGWCPPLPVLRRFGFRTKMALGMIAGFGPHGYVLAIEALANHLGRNG